MRLMFFPFIFFGNLLNFIIPIIFILVIIKVCYYLFSPNQPYKRSHLERGMTPAPPVLAVPAIVIAKRTDNFRGHLMHFVAFEMESGEKFEFVVDSTTYSLLAQEDRGKLTFQGKDFRGFDRMFDNQTRQQ